MTFFSAFDLDLDPMSGMQKSWSPEVFADNSVGYSTSRRRDLRLRLSQVLGKNRKSNAEIVRNADRWFVAYFEKDDVDFEIEIENHLQRNVQFTILVDHQSYTFVIQSGIEASLKTLTSGGKHLHFLSQGTKEGKLLVSLSAKRHGKPYEKASVDCSRIKFQFTLEDQGENAAESRAKRKSMEREYHQWFSHIPDPAMQVLAKTLTGKTVALKVNQSYTIDMVRRLIYLMVGYPPDQQCLIYDGQQLQDCRTLSDYNIRENAMLAVVLKLRGGGGGGGPSIVSQRGVVCFGKRTDQRFEVYDAEFVESKVHTLEGFKIELRTKPRYSLSPWIADDNASSSQI